MYDQIGLHQGTRTLALQHTHTKDPRRPTIHEIDYLHPEGTTPWPGTQWGNDPLTSFTR